MGTLPPQERTVYSVVCLVHINEVSIARPSELLYSAYHEDHVGGRSFVRNSALSSPGTSTPLVETTEPVGFDVEKNSTGIHQDGDFHVFNYPVFRALL